MTLNPVVFDKKAIRKAFNHFAGDMGDVLLDNKYYCLTLEEWKQVIKEIGPEVNKYTPERFDCDDFARVWYGKVAERYEINGMFVVVDYSGEHCYNALLTHDGKGHLAVVLFEPQNGSFPKFGVKPYLLHSGFFV